MSATSAPAVAVAVRSGSRAASAAAARPCCPTAQQQTGRASEKPSGTLVGCGVSIPAVLSSGTPAVVPGWGHDDGDNWADAGAGLSETYVTGDRAARPPSWLTFW